MERTQSCRVDYPGSKLTVRPTDRASSRNSLRCAGVLEAALVHLPISTRVLLDQQLCESERRGMRGEPFRSRPRTAVAKDGIQAAGWGVRATLDRHVEVDRRRLLAKLSGLRKVDEGPVSTTA